ncbi:hypothetical protein [Coleofasciculus sp. FACHB-64]|nr:hypothetical protein [Coleofasciculus sp. FACHB-64]
MIIECLSNRRWEVRPEAFAEILQKLSDESLEEITKVFGERLAE